MSRMIPNSLRKYRKQSGFNQLEVAKHLGMESTNRLSRWENGVAYPSVSNLIKLSALYRTCMNDLYFELFVAIKAEININQQSV